MFYLPDLQTQSRSAFSRFASSTQDEQSVRDEQFTQGNTHIPQPAVLSSKNVSLQVQAGAFSLLFDEQEVQFDEDPEHSAHYISQTILK